jgi:hypothetical protein
MSNGIPPAVAASPSIAEVVEVGSVPTRGVQGFGLY